MGTDTSEIMGGQPQLLVDLSNPHQMAGLSFRPITKGTIQDLFKAQDFLVMTDCFATTQSTEPMKFATRDRFPKEEMESYNAQKEAEKAAQMESIYKAEQTKNVELPVKTEATIRAEQQQFVDIPGKQADGSIVAKSVDLKDLPLKDLVDLYEKISKMQSQNLTGTGDQSVEPAQG